MSGETVGSLSVYFAATSCMTHMSSQGENFGPAARRTLSSAILLYTCHRTQHHCDSFEADTVVLRTTSHR